MFEIRLVLLPEWFLLGVGVYGLECNIGREDSDGDSLLLSLLPYPSCTGVDLLGPSSLLPDTCQNMSDWCFRQLHSSLAIETLVTWRAAPNACDCHYQPGI